MPIDSSNISSGQGGQPAQSTNWTDALGNKLLSFGTSTYTTISATNHNYKGGGVPTLAFSCQNAGASAGGVAAALSLGTFTSTQYTPTGAATGQNCIVGIS